MKKVRLKPEALFGAGVILLVLGYLLLSSPPDTPGRISYPLAADDDKPYEDLRKWLLKSGAEFSAVSGHSRALAGGGRGLFATRPLTEGEEIIRIPLECWISHRSILRGSACAHVLREDPVIQELIREEGTWSSIIGMEYERHNEYSQWKEYFDFMRRQESPIWWSDDDLRLLQSEKIRQGALENKRILDDVYSRVYPHLYEKYPDMWNPEENTKESFYWAALTMWGRSFNLAGENSKLDVEYGVVPIADLLNHDGGRPSTWDMEYNDPLHPDDPTAFVFRANRDTPAGAEVMISYGDYRSSFGFFLFCGFIPRGQTYGDYNAIVVQLRGDSRTLMCAVGNDGRVPVWFIDEIVAGNRVTRFEAVEFLYKHVRSKVHSFATTYASDLQGLAAPDIEYKQWAILTYRARMKKVYTKLLDNLSHLRKNGNLKDQKHEEDQNNEAYHLNKKKGVGADEYALDILKIGKF